MTEHLTDEQVAELRALADRLSADAGMLAMISNPSSQKKAAQWDAEAAAIVALLSSREAALAQVAGMREALVLAQAVVAQQVENEQYCEQQAIRAGHYTPDPKNTHKSAAVKALDAVRAALAAAGGA